MGAARAERRRPVCRGAASSRFLGPFCWWLAASALLVLGINRLLDLQTALGDALRSLAKAQDWYAMRQSYQRAMIAAAALGGVAGAAAFGRLFRGDPVRYHVAIAGLVFLVAFVAIRAVSLHGVDAVINTRILGLKLNWILELGGIGLIDVAAVSAFVPSRTPDPPDDHHGPRTYRISGL
jgi:hypothetical protein